MLGACWLLVSQGEHPPSSTTERQRMERSARHGFGRIHSHGYQGEKNGQCVHDEGGRNGCYGDMSESMIRTVCEHCLSVSHRLENAMVSGRVSDSRQALGPQRIDSCRHYCGLGGLTPVDLPLLDQPIAKPYLKVSAYHLSVWISDVDSKQRHSEHRLIPTE